MTTLWVILQWYEGKAFFLFFFSLFVDIFLMKFPIALILFSPEKAAFFGHFLYLRYCHWTYRKFFIGTQNKKNHRNLGILTPNPTPFWSRFLGVFDLIFDFAALYFVLCVASPSFFFYWKLLSLWDVFCIHFVFFRTHRKTSTAP